MSFVTMFMLGAIMAGCTGQSTSSPSVAEESTGPPPPAGTNVPGARDGTTSAAPTAVGVTAPSDVTRHVATTGVSQKARNVQGMGLVVTPIGAYFRTQDKLTFEINIVHAMKLFRATNGRLPESHEEFMEKIVKQNQIRLPELPAGERYIYDPQAGQLMVELPRTR